MDLLTKSKSTTPLTYKIKGSDYVLKDQENVCSSSLELTKKAAIKEAYFMYGNQLLSPIQHAVPYGTKIKIVVEATNMVGMALELELYKAKNRDDHSYNKSSIRTKNKVIINSHGKAIVEFELQKDWAKDHKTHTYLYVGAESDTFGSYFTKEFHSRMVLAYQEGDVLDDAIEVVGVKMKNKYNPDHSDFHDPVINPQVRGWYNKSSRINKDSNISGWNPYASMNINKNAKHNFIDEVIKYGKPQRATGGHGGIDIYAPVGTPVYACVDGEITHHEMLSSKGGFMTQITGEYKGEKYHFQYLHLMQIEKERFRFYNNYGSKNVLNDGWLKYTELTEELIDPIMKEKYKMQYSGTKIQIDNNTIDIDIAIMIEDKMMVKKGQIIGYTGSTGNSYQGKAKNHLHFGVKDMSEKRISPYELLKKHIKLDISGKETSKKQDGITPSSKW